MNSQLIGFVGVGRMGGHMASRLLDAGYTLCIFDTNPDVIKPLAARGEAGPDEAERKQESTDLRHRYSKTTGGSLDLPHATLRRSEGSA